MENYLLKKRANTAYCNLPVSCTIRVTGVTEDGYKRGYIDGAIEQKKLDIDKACDAIWDIVAPYVNTASECETIQDELRKTMVLDF